MGTSWHGLLANLAIVAIFVLIWMQTHGHRAVAKPMAANIWFGMLWGVGAIAQMFVPFEMDPGIALDLRSTMIAISGFVGGPVSALISGAMAAAFRIHEGGPSLPMCLAGIVCATIVGIAAHRLRPERLPTRVDALVLALAAALSTFAAVIVLPRQEWFETIVYRMPPLAAFVFVGTLMSALAIVQEYRRSELERMNLLYRAIIQALPDCLNAKDLSGRFFAANPATARLMGAGSPEELIGQTNADYFPEDVAQRFCEEERKAVSQGIPRIVEQKIDRADGSVTWLSTLNAPLTDKRGEQIGVITHNRDISDRKKLQAELEESRRRLADALDHMADALAMYDENDRLILCNDRYLEFFPKSAQYRVPGAHLPDILRKTVAVGETQIPEDQTMEEWLADSMRRHHDAADRKIQLTDGRWLETRTRAMRDGGRLLVFSDITSAKNAESDLLHMNARLESLALTDGLTGLANRRSFDQALIVEFGRSRRNGTALSLLLLDVDHFKPYNDCHGHVAGDECLQHLSRCLEKTLCRTGSVATRYGGEEFAIILPEADLDEAAMDAERVLQAVRDLRIPHHDSDRKIVTVSIGVASIQPADGNSPAELINQADKALYVAKSEGRDRLHAWQPAAEPARKQARQTS